MAVPKEKYQRLEVGSVELIGKLMITYVFHM